MGMTSFDSLLRLTLSLRRAGLDRWTCSEPAEREHLIHIEESPRPGYLRLAPLFIPRARLELPAELAIEVVSRFADGRQAEAQGEPTTTDGAMRLWDQLYNAAEAKALEGVA